jgi:acyl-CoA thioester hydrolase
MSDTHIVDFRVYYEDTDAGGVVYYANYLKYAERARTEMLREKGIDQSELAQKDDILFVVRHAELDLNKPARLDDVINISSFIEEIGGAKLNITQKMVVNSHLVAQVKVVIAIINKDFKPIRLPEKLKEKLVN